MTFNPFVNSEEAHDEVPWTTKIGATQTVQLDSSKIGDRLVDGEKVVLVIVDENGRSRTLEGCRGIPEIEVSKFIGLDEYDIETISMRLDAETCDITLASVEKVPPTLYDGQQRTIQQKIFVANVLNSIPTSNATNTQIVFLPQTKATSRDDGGILGMQSSGQAIPARVKTEVQAADGAGFSLTRADVEIRYDTGDFTVYNERHACNVFSPAGWAGVEWIKDACRSEGSQVNSSGTEITGATEGDFHAEVSSNHEEHGDSEHTSRAHIRGRSNG